MDTFDKRVLYAFAALLCLACVPLLSGHKGDLVIMLNNMHTPYLDWMAVNLTRFGNGIIFLPLIAIASAYRYRYGILLAGTGILHALISYLLKHQLFSEALRPKAYFGDLVQLVPVPGVEIHSLHAFPSGHTATAFAAVLMLILIIRKPAAFLLITVAAGVALSRVYLAQHFYADILAGAMLGSFSSMTIYLVSRYVQWPDWSAHGWLRRKAVTELSDLNTP